MATSAAFKDFVLDRLEQCAREGLNENLKGDFSFSARNMFGEYCVYIIDSACSEGGILGSGKKVLFLLCDEQVFIKKYKVLEQIAQDFSAYFSLGFPFSGAREHYIIDIENLELLATIIKSTLPYLPAPKVKNPKKLSNKQLQKF